MSDVFELVKQIIKYQSTAIICGIIDYALLIGLTEFLGVHYLAASVIGLTVAMTVQYILNVMFVFEAGEGRDPLKIPGYIALGFMGVGFNTLIVYVAVDKIGLNYVLGKMCSSAIVGIYNFVSRKLFLENIDRAMGRIKKKLGLSKEEEKSGTEAEAEDTETFPADREKEEET